MIPLCNFAADLPIANFNHIANLDAVARDVDNLAVDHDVAMRDQLSGLRDRVGIAEPVHDRLQPHFEQPEEVKPRVAVHPLRFIEGAAELLFKHAVVASDDLLRHQLLAVLGHASVPHVRTMLTGRIRSFGAWALGLTPNIEADFAADIVCSSSVCRHAVDLALL